MKIINKAALIIPPVRDFYFTPHRFSALGAQIVKEILEKESIEVNLFNFPQSKPGGYCIALPEELSYLKSFLIENEKGKTAFFTKYRQFGPSIKDCVKEVLSVSPDICFISCFAFCYAEPALELAKEIKSQNPDITIVFGGAGVSAYPEYFLKSEHVDYTLSGEAEISLSDFIHNIRTDSLRKTDIANLGWKEENSIRFSEKNEFTKPNDIRIPFSVTMGKNGATFVSTSISRGCNRRCRFCSNHLTHGPSFRITTAAKFEIFFDTSFRNKMPSFLRLNFEDDNLLNDYECFIETMKYVKRLYPDASFYAENGIDYRLLTPQRCRELITLGMKQFNFTLGSVSKSLLDEERRETDLDLYSTIVNEIAGYKIPVITYFICGFADETIESLASTVAFLHSKPTQIGISMFYPVPGITGFKDKRRFDNISPALCAGSSAYPWNNSMSTETMITAFRLSRLCNMIKSVDLNDQEKELIRLFFETGKIHTFVKDKDKKLQLYEVQGMDGDFLKVFKRKASLFAN
jgi:anaerobic magnesium-protoporphyrin IX monomethyl ester cyclase